MTIAKKTKEERKASRPDTPLAETPDFNVNTVMADINKRSAERKAAIDERQKKLDNARKERSRTKRAVGGVGGRLQGLASLKNTLGTQYYKQSDSENS
jgi:hypothetical protein